jgi:uncharacterized protein YeaC (DUF1315 family)
MDYKQLVQTMTPEIYRSMRDSLERGKWPDGRVLTSDQREHSMQALIMWGLTHLPEHEQIGYVDKGHKGGDVCDEPQETPLAWKD